MPWNRSTASLILRDDTTRQGRERGSTKQSNGDVKQLLHGGGFARLELCSSHLPLIAVPTSPNVSRPNAHSSESHICTRLSRDGEAGGAVPPSYRYANQRRRHSKTCDVLSRGARAHERERPCPSPVSVGVFEHPLVVLGQGGHVNHGRHVVEAVDPLLPLVTLPPNVVHLEGRAVNAVFVHHNPCKCGKRAHASGKYGRRSVAHLPSVPTSGAMAKPVLIVPA